MFERIWQWLKGVWAMLNPGSVKDQLGVEAAVSSEMLEALELWSKMYKNESPWLNADIAGLNLPAVIANEIARATTIEMKVTFEGGARAKYFEGIMEQISPKLRQMVEYGVAKGGLIFKPYVHNGEVVIDYVQADQFFPTAFDANGNIVGCVFSDQNVVGDRYYTKLEVHTMGKDGCTIRNYAFRSQSPGTLGVQVSLSEVATWSDLEQVATITEIKKPLFSYFRYPAANTIDTTSPLGMSAYARAIDLVKQADQIWSNLLWEFDSGQRALFVDVLAFGKDAEGKAILPNRRLYRAIETGSVEGDFFQEWSPDFREASLLSGLEAILKRIEFNVGLAYGTLSDPNQVDKTATEILSSRQRSYATVVDVQKSLKNALLGLFEAIDVWVTLNKLAPKSKYEMSFEFDDSIVVNKDEQLQQDLRLVTTSIMSKLEFRMRNFGEDEETARAKLGEVEEEQAAAMLFEVNTRPGQGRPGVPGKSGTSTKQKVPAGR